MAGVHPQARKYLESRVLTASKEELLLMLLDGAVRFVEAARQKLEDRKLDDFCNSLIRAQRIVSELMTTLRKDVIGEEIYNNLMGLYSFVYRRLVEANLQRDTGMLDEGLKILRLVRDMWREAVEKYRTEAREGGVKLDDRAPGFSYRT